MKSHQLNAHCLSIPPQRCSVTMRCLGFRPNFKLKKLVSYQNSIKQLSNIFRTQSNSKMELFRKKLHLRRSKCTFGAINNYNTPYVYVTYTNTRCPSSTTNAPPSPVCALGTKQDFTIRELRTVFGKLQIEITKENCETTFFCFAH